jgi:PTS system mannose-specific IIA component
MVGIVVVGHGRIGEEAVRTLQSVVGTIDAFEAVTTSTIERPEEIRARIRAAVDHVRRDRGVLILTDMLGDTQTNQAMAIAREVGAEVIAGMNMPMLVKATTARGGCDARALAELLTRYGREHIVWATAGPGR